LICPAKHQPKKKRPLDHSNNLLENSKRKLLPLPGALKVVCVFNMDSKVHLVASDDAESSPEHLGLGGLLSYRNSGDSDSDSDPDGTSSSIKLGGVVLHTSRPPSPPPQIEIEGG
jgi:hypothetical protein